MPWFSVDDWPLVYITEAAFTDSGFNAYDIASNMVHEAVHAWQQYSILQMVENPNSDFRRFNSDYYTSITAQSYRQW